MATGYRWEFQGQENGEFTAWQPFEDEAQTLLDAALANGESEVFVSSNQTMFQVDIGGMFLVDMMTAASKRLRRVAIDATDMDRDTHAFEYIFRVTGAPPDATEALITERFCFVFQASVVVRRGPDGIFEVAPVHPEDKDSIAEIIAAQPILMLRRGCPITVEVVPTGGEPVLAEGPEPEPESDAVMDEAAAPVHEWECLQCTLINPLGVEECQACGLPAPQHEPEPAQPPEQIPRPHDSCCICQHAPDNADEAILCEVRAHRVCLECLPGLVDMHLEPVRLRASLGDIPCPGLQDNNAACAAQPWRQAEILPLLPAAVRDRYVAALQGLLRVVTQAPVPGAAAPAANAVPAPARAPALKPAARAVAEREVDVAGLRARLLDALNLRCPRCATVFHDYDGCDALTCAACGAGFCAVCLADCGTDAHRHCAQVHGNVYGGRDNFERVHRVRRERLITEFLQELPEQTARALIVSVEKDLRDLGHRVENIRGRIELEPEEVEENPPPSVQEMQRVLLLMQRRWSEHIAGIAVVLHGEQQLPQPAYRVPQQQQYQHNPYWDGPHMFGVAAAGVANFGGQAKTGIEGLLQSTATALQQEAGDFYPRLLNIERRHHRGRGRAVQPRNPALLEIDGIWDQYSANNQHDQIGPRLINLLRLFRNGTRSAERCLREFNELLQDDLRKKQEEIDRAGELQMLTQQMLRRLTDHQRSLSVLKQEFLGQHARDAQDPRQQHQMLLRQQQHYQAQPAPDAAQQLLQQLQACAERPGGLGTGLLQIEASRNNFSRLESQVLELLHQAIDGVSAVDVLQFFNLEITERETEFATELDQAAHLRVALQRIQTAIQQPPQAAALRQMALPPATAPLQLQLTNSLLQDLLRCINQAESVAAVLDRWATPALRKCTAPADALVLARLLEILAGPAATRQERVAEIDTLIDCIQADFETQKVNQAASIRLLVDMSAHVSGLHGIASLNKLELEETILNKLAQVLQAVTTQLQQKQPAIPLLDLLGRDCCSTAPPLPKLGPGESTAVLQIAECIRRGLLSDASARQELLEQFRGVVDVFCAL
eukprot:TRINITY_DN9884_c0_g1_i4.p1 TRINITY_DN9884_c0_g1~~TRINITY_DN9884_c0_g1_i4.p1  ORF type:complete len:1080 (+),score=153.92 TRINITY_DN9884_c0_g1_i4:57-3242(+)